MPPDAIKNNYENRIDDSLNFDFTEMQSIVIKGRVSSTLTKSLANLVNIFPMKWESKNFMVLLTTQRTIALWTLIQARLVK